MKQYKVLKQKLKSTNGEFFIYRFLSKKCRSAYNIALANIKKHYEEENKYIGKYDNFTELQNHDLTNWLNKEIFQRTIYKADTAYRSYFELLKYQKNNNLEITAKEPDYINGYFPITFSYIGNKYENGKRVKRGLYETKEGKYINADLNGALNIYRKSSVCDMKVISNLIRRGVSTPKRLQII